MATIEKRPGKRGTKYRALVRRKGARTLSRTFTRKVDAESWARQTEADIERGQAVTTEARRHTVAGMIQRYIKQILPDRRQDDHANFRHMLGFWDDRLGHLTLAELNPARVAECKGALQAGTNKYGRPYSPATIYAYLSAFSLVCRTAVREWRILTANPVEDVSRPPLPNGRVRYLTPDDEKPRLLAACETDARLCFLVRLALATGGRRGELLGLRWREVDLERGSVTFLETKNGTHRSVALTGKELELARTASRDKLPSQLVFATSTTASAAKQAPFPRHAWDRALQEAQIEDFVFHDLRHTHASYLAMSGATLREIAEALGHRTLDMVMRYAHLAPDHNRTVVARMADRFLQ